MSVAVVAGVTAFAVDGVDALAVIKVREKYQSSRRERRLRHARAVMVEVGYGIPVDAREGIRGAVDRAIEHIKALWRSFIEFVKKYPHVILAMQSLVLLFFGQIVVALLVACGALYEHVRTKLLISKMEGE